MPNKSKDAVKERKVRPSQSQKRQPGRESKMRPPPQFENPEFSGSGRLSGRVALVTGGDS